MLYAIVAVIALIIDQAVKYWTSAHIVLNSGRHELIPGFIHLANVHNTGAAFSFMQGGRWLFVILCAAFVGVVIFLMVKKVIRGKAARWFAVLVMAGAAGNCVDRIINGYVVDMLEFDFKILGRPFPVFNVADILIVVCGLAFCLCILLERPDEEPDKAADGEAGGGQRIRPRRAAAPEGNITPFPGLDAPDAGDPFAEWEQPSPAKKSADIPGSTSKSSAPKRAARSTLDEPMSHVHPVSAPEERRSAPEVRVREPEVRARETEVKTRAAEVRTRAAQPAPEPRPAAGKRPDDAGFDLDDILAEFRDL